MTKHQREAEFQRKKCAECDRMAQALTFTPTKVIRRCVAHWVAYYRRRETMAFMHALAEAEPDIVRQVADLWIAMDTDIPKVPRRREGMA